QGLGFLKEGFVFGAKNHLYPARPVSDVAKNDPAMVPPAVHPPTNSRGLADVGFAQITAINGSFHSKDELYNRPIHETSALYLRAFVSSHGVERRDRDFGAGDRGGATRLHVCPGK